MSYRDDAEPVLRLTGLAPDRRRVVIFDPLSNIQPCRHLIDDEALVDRVFRIGGEVRRSDAGVSVDRDVL